MSKRNPRLVPYNLLDEKTKKTNRDTVCSAVRTLIGYGYNIEPPDQESSKSERAGGSGCVFCSCFGSILKARGNFLEARSEKRAFRSSSCRCGWTRQLQRR